MKLGLQDAIVSVVLPCRNEAEPLAGLIAEIYAEGVDEIVVVDNQSSDATAAVAEAAGARVVREQIPGYGRACALGLASVRSDADIVCFMDGDGSDIPRYIPALARRIADGNVDFVMGSRLLGHRESGSMTPQQLVAGRIAGVLLKAAYGVTATDMSPFRAMRREAMQGLGMREPTYGWNLEMQMRVAASGLRIEEVPVDHRRRRGGVSKVSGNLVAGLTAAWIISRTFVRLWWQLRAAPFPHRRPTLILVTGGAGFIGRHVVNGLRAGGHDVRVLDSLRPDVHRDGVLSPLPAQVHWLHGDIRDAATVDKALIGVDAVIHLAAKVGLGVDVSDLPDYASSNDVGVAELLAGMARNGVSRLTLASSMVVYGEGDGLCAEHGAVRPAPRRADDLAAGRFEPPCPVCGRPLGVTLVGEDDAFDPRNAYATSKAAQEYYGANWARATGGSMAAMRYHNVYGPGMPKDTPYAGVAAIFLSALRRGDAPTVFEDGGQRRDFVHVRDVAAATIAACELHLSGVRAFNVGSGTPRTVGQMAEALSAALDGPKPVVTGQFRLGDVRHITADSSRLRNELRWQPQIAFEDGMRELSRTL